jgi:tRNA pseudouridine38-40 synthase
VSTYRLILEYDGRDFVGWQLQPRQQRSVQGVLHEAVRRVTGESVRVIGAGRTDAGVHAEGQVASLALDAAPDPDRLRRALNGVLPADVAVVDCATMPEGFHARYQAKSKLYRYRIWNGQSPSPLRTGRTHRVPSRLDVSAMREAADALVGSHDFASFQAAGSEVRSTVRRLHRVEVSGEPGGEIRLEVEGQGFLRHMVRILAGTLIEVGLGRREAGSLPEVLAARDRSRAGRTAPAHGLTLVRVAYE